MRGLIRGDLLRVCYGKYGCFSLDHPWASIRRLVYMYPKSPNKIWPKFMLYTRRTGMAHQMQHHDRNTINRIEENVSRGDFDPNR